MAPDVEFNTLVDTATGKPVIGDHEFARRAPTPCSSAPSARAGAWRYLHRQGQGYDFYFLSNQEYFPVSTDVSFRVTGRIPELWYADTGKIVEAPVWREQGGRTIVSLDFDPAGSVFVVFRKASTAASGGKGLRRPAAGVPAPIVLGGFWNVTFPLKGQPKQIDLEAGSWTSHSDEDVKYFSGTATYKKTFTVPAERKGVGQRLVLDLGDVQNLARVRLNGKDLGVLWKAPYVIDVTRDVVAGANRLEIEVTNTWFNRLAGDTGKPQDQRVTWAGAAGRGFGAGGAAAGGPPVPPPLLPAGRIGPVRVVFERRLSIQV